MKREALAPALARRARAARFALPPPALLAPDAARRGRRAGRGSVATCRSRSWPSSTVRSASKQRRAAQPRRRPRSSSSPAATSSTRPRPRCPRCCASRPTSRSSRSTRAICDHARAASTASRRSNKLLVLIDGRSVYSTLHSGVFWELHDAAARGYRADRGDQRPGRHALRPQCGQRRDQHHQPRRARDPGRPGPRHGRRASGHVGARYGVALGDERRGPRLRQLVRPRGPAARARRPARTTLPRLAGGLPRRLRRRRRPVHPAGRHLRQRRRQRCPATATAATICWPAGPTRLADDRSLQVQAYYDDYRAPLPARQRLARRPSTSTPSINAGLGAPRSRRSAAACARRATSSSTISTASSSILRAGGCGSQRLRPGPDRADPDARPDRRRQARAAPASPASSSCPTCASPGSRRRAPCLGARCRGRCAPRRGSTASSSSCRCWRRATDFESREADRLRGRLSRPAERQRPRSRSRSSSISTTTSGRPSSPATRLPIRLQNGLEGHTYGVEAWADASSSRPGGGSASASPRSVKDFRAEDRAGRPRQQATRSAHDPNYPALARSQMRPDRPAAARRRPARGRRSRARRGIGGYVEADARLAWRLIGADRALRRRQQPAPRHPSREQRRRSAPSASERSVYAGTRLRF